MTDIQYWIGLSYVPEVGPLLSKRLLASFGSPEDIFRADLNDLLSVEGMTRERAVNIREFSQWDATEKALKSIRDSDITVIGYDNSRYPEPLRQMADAPVVLYMRGDYQPDDRFALAVVGSRRLTEYGEGVTLRIANELSRAGFTIISGMARGIDTLAHRSTLVAGGRTIAVFGSGPDICYPAENRGLMQKIISSGCVLSEFAPGTEPRKEHFPRRNRLISGLSLGVLVVEATAKSGALITAQYALEQNKEVFAVPGRITSKNSEGTNRLIKQGARIVLDTEDIIEELAPMLKGFIKRRDDVKQAISEEESRICDSLTREPKHIDILARETGMPSHEILNTLLSLELKGIARQSQGKRFSLV
jgi:DNA processing protein